ncbi:MAG: nucleotide exchange factor GrpE [Hyphomicrobiales bacterium]|nr:nucleotide exchange factor GrpE [Hyphomicrobiales bacterium]
MATQPNEQAQPETEQPETGEATAEAPQPDANMQAVADAYQQAQADTPSPEQEIAMLKDQLLRTLAEMENTKRRAQREIEDSRKYAVSSMAQELIGVLENLHRAQENVPQDQLIEGTALKTLYDGLELTRNELLKVFEKNGIRRIDPQGEPFDHNYHQALAQIEDPNAAPGTVVQVMQAGYVIHDRLLRPALVGVAKAPEGNAS